MNTTGDALREEIEHIAVQEDAHALEKGDDVKVKDGAKVKEGGLLLVRAGGSELISEHAGVVQLGKTNMTVIWEGPSRDRTPRTRGVIRCS